MIITLIFCAVAIFGAVRTVCFAVFTAEDKNYAGATMLFILAAVVLACTVSAALQL